MGFRLHIYKVSDPDNEYGDDHKLYGYFPYEKVKRSFDYIHSFIVEQDDVFNFDTYRNSSSMSYDLVCRLPYVGPITLSADEFKEFMVLYLMDIKENKSKSCYNFVTSYVNELNSTNDDKCLEWY